MEDLCLALTEGRESWVKMGGNEKENTRFRSGQPFCPEETDAPEVHLPAHHQLEEVVQMLTSGARAII